MFTRGKRSKAAVTFLVLASLLGAACGDDDDDNAAPEETEEGAGTEEGENEETAAPAADGADAASGLRSALTYLLGEHVYIAALATGAALRGDMPAQTALVDALNGPANSNTTDLVAGVASVYGPEVGTAFEGLWRSENHIPQFVNYTVATSKNDEAGKAAAVTALTAYAKEFGTTMNTVNPKLPAADVEGAITMHATTLLAVIDAQGAKDQPGTYVALRAAYKHMGDAAAALAGGTAANFPDKVTGDAASPAAGLRAALTSLLGEHVWLAQSATGAALGGRTEQMTAVVEALNGMANSNTTDLVAGVASVYGPEVGTAFEGLWRSENHIPQFVAYTVATSKNDEAGKTAAVTALTAYAKEFGTTMNTVNPKLPAADVEAAITMHATTLIAVIDAQGKKDPAGAITAARAAVQHMSATAAAITAGTVANFPDKF